MLLPHVPSVRAWVSRIHGNLASVTDHNISGDTPHINAVLGIFNSAVKILQAGQLSFIYNIVMIAWIPRGAKKHYSAANESFKFQDPQILYPLVSSH